MLITCVISLLEKSIFLLSHKFGILRAIKFCLVVVWMSEPTDSPCKQTAKKTMAESYPKLIKDRTSQSYLRLIRDIMCNIAN